MTRPKGPRIYPECSRCSDRHHNWAYCIDGVRRRPGAPLFKPGNLQGKPRPEPDQSATTLTTAPAVTVTASGAREELRTLAATLPEDSQQRRSLELLIQRDEARQAHQRDEEALAATTPGARLPVPTILRDTSDERGRHLNMEMDRLIFAAGTGPRTQKEVLPREAAVVHDTLASLDEARERKAQQPRPPAHRPGDQPWFCTACGQRFRTGTMAQVREWARAEPDWRPVCPECHSIKIQIIEVAS